MGNGSEMWINKHDLALINTLRCRFHTGKFINWTMISLNTYEFSRNSVKITFTFIKWMIYTDHYIEHNNLNSILDIYTLSTE